MKEEADILCTKVHAVCYAAQIFSANSFSSLQASEGLLGRYTPFGNSMRSLALLRLVGGKDFWKSVRAASSWCFGRHGLEHWYFYLRSCRFGISLMCQFHWELDCVGFSPFEIWRCGCVEMMRGIGGAQRPMLICIILHWLLWLPECAASHWDLFSNIDVALTFPTNRRCTDFPDWV